MGIIRDSFIIFKNWADAINALPEEYQLETYKALVEFGTTGEIPEGLSQIANAMLVSFSVGMEKNISRYTASVENGKKGGRPRKDKASQLSEENKNLEKPRKTQENLTEPTQNLYVNDNVNVNKLVKDIKNINKVSNAGVRTKNVLERQEYLEQFKEFFEYQSLPKFTEPAYEIIDTMLNFLEMVQKGKTLIFRQKKYDRQSLKEVFAKISCDKFSKIVEQLVFNETITNRDYYILGCLLNDCRGD